MRYGKQGSMKVVATGVLVALLAACGGSPPTTSVSEDIQSAAPESEATGEAGPSGPPESLDDVYVALEGLEGDERHDQLLSMARAEQDAGAGAFTVYLTASLEISEPWIDAFQEATGLDAELYRASSSDLLQRLVQEADAGYEDGADVVNTNEPEMLTLDNEFGIFSPLRTPVSEDIEPVVVHDNWLGNSANTFLVTWNTNIVDDPPTSYEDMCSERFKGQLLFEVTDWEWFGTIVQQYFMDDLGWSEDEAVEFWKDCVRGNATTDGHTLATNLLVSGEYQVAVQTYINRVQFTIDEGAPIAWEPPVQPVISRPAGVGIHQTTDRPATSLLFVEFFLTDLQSAFAEENFIPMNTTVEGNPISEYDSVFQDTESLLGEREKWEGLYEEVMMGAGDFVEDPEDG